MTRSTRICLDIYMSNTATQILINQARRNHKGLRANENKTNPTSRPTYRQNTINYYRKELEKAMASLTETAPTMAGMLTEEFNLIDTIAASRKAGFARPELAKRLRAIRKEVK